MPRSSTIPLSTPTIELSSEPPFAEGEPLAQWAIYQHKALGIEIRHPPNWYPYDYTSAFVRFCAEETCVEGELFNIVNAPFDPIERASDFLDRIGPTVIATKTLVIDGQPALFMQLQGDDAAAGYQSVVGLIRPDGHTVIVSNQGVAPALFEQILSTIRYIEAINPPW
jgi:hypothetical protein